MTRYLLDANVVIALSDLRHVHHASARTWFGSIDSAALCPITEGALVRYLLHKGESGATAAEVLEGLHAHPHLSFVADSASYRDVDLASLRGHRQATDAYLVALARHHGAVLATFDAALAAAWPEHTELIEAPTGR